MSLEIIDVCAHALVFLSLSSLPPFPGCHLSNPKEMKLYASSRPKMGSQDSLFKSLYLKSHSLRKCCVNTYRY